MAETVTIPGKGTNDALGTGRRKSSVARVRVRPGEGRISINKRALEDYFPREQQQQAVLAPLERTGKRNVVAVIIRGPGGGGSGRAGAAPAAGPSSPSVEPGRQST